MSTAIEDQVSQHYLGAPVSASELQLAMIKSKNYREGKTSGDQVRIVIETVSNYRKPFRSASALSTEEGHREFLEQVDRAARLELSQGSDNHSKLVKLDLEKLEIESKIKSEELALTKLWTEFNSLPEACESASQRKNKIASELASLTGLDQAIKDAYRAVLTGHGSTSLLDKVTLAKIRAPLIKDVIETELSSVNERIANLKAKNAELAKQLKTTPHQLC